MNIKTITAISTAAILSMVAVLSLLLLGPANASAQGSTNNNSTNRSNNNQTARPAVTYNYVAQTGDSYSKMARKAIQTYGIKNKVNLSTSQIMYAETNLTQQAGSPYLNKGQAVNVTEATVKSWVDKAKALSAQDAAKWDKYTTNVNFNTDNVGEAR